jgi:hypothetical protein
MEKVRTMEDGSGDWMEYLAVCSLPQIGRGAIVLWLLASLGVSSLTAQQVLPPGVSCERCTVAWTEVLRLGEGDEPGFVESPFISVTIDGRGRYWIVSSEGQLPKVYSRTGQFVGEVGRKGEGPGEFRHPDLAFPIPGDSMALLDLGLQRVSVVDPDLSIVRTSSLIGQYYGAVVTEWPLAIVNGIVGTPAAVGLPYHLIDLRGREGTILDSFGGSGAAIGPQNRRMLLGRLAPGRGDWFWTVLRSDYSVQKRNWQGEILESFISRPPWFPEPAPLFWQGNTPPTQSITGLWEAPDGLVWAFVRVPRSDWRKGLQAFLSGESRTPDPQTLRRTNVEVVDLKSRRVVARSEMDDLVTSVLADGTVAVYRIREDGVPYVSILRGNLSGSPMDAGASPADRR